MYFTCDPLIPTKLSLAQRQIVFVFTQYNLNLLLLTQTQDVFLHVI